MQKGFKSERWGTEGPGKKDNTSREVKGIFSSLENSHDERSAHLGTEGIPF